MAVVLGALELQGQHQAGREAFQRLQRMASAAKVLRVRSQFQPQPTQSLAVLAGQGPLTLRWHQALAVRPFEVAVAEEQEDAMTQPPRTSSVVLVADPVATPQAVVERLAPVAHHLPLVAPVQMAQLVSVAAAAEVVAPRSRHPRTAVRAATVDGPVVAVAVAESA